MSCSGNSSNGFFAQSSRPEVEQQSAQTSNPADWNLPASGSQGFFGSAPAPAASTSFGKASDPSQWKLSGSSSGFFAGSSAPQTSTDFPKASDAKDWKLSGSKGFFDQASVPQAQTPSKPEPKAETPKPATSASSQGFYASSSQAPSKPQPVSLAKPASSAQVSGNTKSPPTVDLLFGDLDMFCWQIEHATSHPDLVREVWDLILNPSHGDRASEMACLGHICNGVLLMPLQNGMFVHNSAIANMPLFLGGT